MLRSVLPPGWRSSTGMNADLIVYAVPLLAVVVAYRTRRVRREQRNREIHAAIQQAGLVTPASLHPLIDAAECIGCAACVSACPENGVLGIIGDRAELINPTHCIGHGACRDACPADAITLVFGSAERGVDIPLVSPDFESNVPGIYIAGELGGMGLIRNAIEQGRQALEAIARRPGDAGELDVVIVGAGPAGFSASLAALKRKLRFVTLEQETLGGTVAHYPRGKIVMTAPAELPLVGKMRFRETTKEKLLEFWQGAARKTGVEIRYGERVEAVTPSGQGFRVRSARGEYHTRNVLLALGRRGTPRKLDVPGEDRESVVYSLVDPTQYAGKQVLVVGGGDSAIEAALSLCEQAETRVTLSYRGEAFSRAKPKNRDRIEAARASSGIQVLLPSRVTEIGDGWARLDRDGAALTVPVDAVIVCAGGVLPTPFLKTIGVEVETRYGTS